MRRAALLSALLVACGSEPAATPPEPAPGERGIDLPDPEPGEAPGAPDLPEAPDAELVDLLHAVPTTLTVSSAFGGDAARVGQLYDGDVTTSWCSEASNLDGAWIEVRLPAGASIDHLRITNGDTASRNGRDVYHAQHRVRRVRVSRNGAEVGTFPLDPEDQTLQRVPASGDGGTWRIEVVDVSPGTDPSLREVCSSELRIMGTAPDQDPGSTSPDGRVSSTAPVLDEASGAEDDFVELLHAVPTTVRVSSVMEADPAWAEGLADGGMEEGWSAERGDALSAWVEVDLPAGATVARMEIFPGSFGADEEAFLASPRISRVRLVHDDVPFGTYDLDSERRELSRVEAMGSGGRWRIEVVGMAGAMDEETSAIIAELRIFGQAPGAAPGEHEPTYEVAPPSVEEGDEAPALTLATDPAEGSVFGSAEGLRVTELTLGPAVESRQVSEPRTTFSRATDTRVYCLVRLDNPSREATGITMAWERTDAESPADGRLMNVPAQPRYVTFGFTGTRRRAGRYRCVIRTAGGALLGSAAFDLEE